MTTFWTITTSAPTIALDGSRRATAALTVTNTGPGPDRAVVQLVPSDPAMLSWLALSDPQRTVAAGATAVFDVAVTVPPDAPPGAHWFQGRVYSADTAPEENSQLSDRIAFEVPAPAPPAPKRSFRWWPIAAGLAMVLVAGIIVFIATRKPQIAPDIVGLTYDQATQKLQDSGLDGWGHQRRYVAGTPPGGRVESTDPPAGRPITGTNIQFVLAVDLAPPEPEAPFDGTPLPLDAPSPGLSWTAVADAAGYEVTIEREVCVSGIVYICQFAPYATLSTDAPALQTDIPVGHRSGVLPDAGIRTEVGTHWQWRVAARDDFGTVAPAGPTWTFAFVP